MLLICFTNCICRSTLFDVLKANTGKQAREVEAAVHFIYDIAGRAEDAIGVKWSDITRAKLDGAVVKIQPGKTEGGMQCLTRPTLDMLYEFKNPDS